ncbi:MAG: hypothetical protein HQM08_18580 [Candidatus Riflebacteria bacterium]|nr:hypothetical protein [Candidatus Riflebacteria bacterium]
MIIANPIYDVVFKRLMEDKKIARFFIETLIGETITDIQVKPQEFTFYREIKETDDPRKLEEIREKIYGLFGLSVYRLDFIATIKTSDNQFKKVLIEIQKAKKAVDLMRFRNYLGDQYKKTDEIETDDGKVQEALPIRTIYLLGFELAEIDTSLVKVERQYIDLIDHKILDQKSPFIEKLSHDCFVVQLPRIKPRLKTRIEKLLSVFEQANFLDNQEIIKDYPYVIDEEVIKSMIDLLHHAGTDPAEKKELEKEQEALRVFEDATKDLEKQLNEISKKLIEKEIALSEKDKALSEKDKALSEKDKALSEKDKDLSEKDKDLSEKDKALSEKDKDLSEKDKALGEKDKVLSEKDRALQESMKRIKELEEKLSVK